MKQDKMIIGKDTRSEYDFNTAVEWVTNYLKNVRALIIDLDLTITDSQLLNNSTDAIKQAYIDKHIQTLPAYLTEQDLLQSLKVDFTYINNNSIKLHAIRQRWGIDKDGLKTKDFNIYADTIEQYNAYIKLNKICNDLNELYESEKGKFSLFLGQIANSFSGVIETNLSMLPHIQVNTSALKSIY